MERYIPIASASIAKFDGKYLVRGNSAKETLEGGWKPEYLIVVEFPDADRLREWYHSEDYAPALEVRHRAGPRDLILVEGSVSADYA
ncbi:MAG: DUF1330 domain-containing protein [Gemmatimonadaceae bacterium]